MNNQTYKKRIKALKDEMLSDMQKTVAGQGTLLLLDTPTADATYVRFYVGMKYPAKEHVLALRAADDGHLLVRTAEGERDAAQMHSADVPVLNKAVEILLGCTTPAKLATLLNRNGVRADGNGPLAEALAAVVRRNDWYDLSGATAPDERMDLCWCEKEKTLVRVGARGKAVCVRIPEGYASTELLAQKAEQWYAATEFHTMESLSGLRRDDYDPADGEQAFVDAVDAWWAALPRERKINEYLEYNS